MPRSHSLVRLAEAGEQCAVFDFALFEGYLVGRAVEVERLDNRRIERTAGHTQRSVLNRIAVNDQVDGHGLLFARKAD